MNKLKIIFTLTAAIIIAGCSKQKNDNGQTINSAIGDLSFISKFGHQPTAKTDENLRIMTHLEYVENVLRQKDVSNLTAAQKEKRKNLLDLLHQYWIAGIFPSNYDYPDKRVPCFIDKDGRICAVGYLIEQTVGRQIAEQINGSHKYDKLLAMNDRTVDQWIETSGLTKEECAMIQPSYGPPPSYNYNYISPAYGITSSVLGGVNLSFCTMNAFQIGKGANRLVPIMGLLTGAGTIIYGTVNFPTSEGLGMYASTNESKKTLSMLNIGLGTMTMMMSIWNLSKPGPKPNKSVTWNLYGFPAPRNQIGLGLYWTKKI